MKEMRKRMDRDGIYNDNPVFIDLKLKWIDPRLSGYMYIGVEEPGVAVCRADTPAPHTQTDATRCDILTIRNRKWKHAFKYALSPLAQEVVDIICEAEHHKLLYELDSLRYKFTNREKIISKIRSHWLVKLYNKLGGSI